MMEIASGPIPRRREKQDAMFDNIYIIVSKIMTVEGRLSRNEEIDESANRTSSLLHTLAALTIASATCEKKSVFAFYQVTQENNIEKDLVIKVLNQVSRRLQYPNLRNFSSAHLAFVLTQWLESGYTFDQFPYQLTGHSTLKEFYANNYKIVVPVMLMKQTSAALESVASHLHVSETDLLKHCLSRILVLVLPKFALATLPPAQREQETHRGHLVAAKVYDKLVKAIGKEATEESIVTKLDEIVVQTLMCIHVSNKRLDDPNLALLEAPEPNPPCYSRKVITATLEYLVTNHSSSADSIVALLSKSQDGIQRVLLALHQALSRTHRIFEKRRILYMYQLFVRLLLRELDSGLGGNHAFVLRDIIYTLLYFLEGTMEPKQRPVMNPIEEDLICSALELLQEVFAQAIGNFYNELGRFLSFITSTLIKIAGNRNKVGEKALSILTFLMEEHKVELADYLKLLPPPPDTDTLKNLRAAHSEVKYKNGDLSLSKEFEYFLSSQASCQSAMRGSVEALHFLRQKIGTSKQELITLINCTKDVMDFPDGGPPSLLINLLRELLALLSSKDELVSLEASRVLGEIGPVEFDMVALTSRLHPQLEAALSLYEGNPKAQQYCHILHMLDQYLTDPNVSVVAAASLVLKKVLATKLGHDFYNDYNKNLDNALVYLHPFCLSKKKVTAQSKEIGPIQTFIDAIDNEELWYSSNSNHGKWITALVRAIIASGSVSDPVLSDLTPICDVKVEMCEVILPFLLHDILVHGSEVHRDILSRHVQTFFTKHCQLVDDCDSKNSAPSATGDICQDVKSVRVMLNVVQYLRLQDRPMEGRRTQTAWNKNWWLTLDYLTLAKAASNSSSYFTSLLFAEIWCGAEKNKSEESSQHSRSGSQELEFRDLSFISNLPEHTDINIQELMLGAYRNLGDQDGMYGCGAGKLADKKTRTQTYEHENKWNNAVGSYDINLSLNSIPNDQVGIVQALKKFGAGYVLEKYLIGLNASGADEEAIRDFQFEAAWRNNNWDKSPPTRFEDPVGFHESIYSSLSAVQHRDNPMLVSALDHARKVTVKQASTANVKIMSCICPILSQFHCLNQLDLTAKLLQSEESNIITTMETFWTDHDQILHHDFDLIEEPLLQRCRLLHQMNVSYFQQGEAAPEITEVSRALSHQLVCFARQARLANRHLAAERALLELRHMMENGNLDTGLTWKLEEAQLYWSRGEIDTAKHLMRGLLGTLSQDKGTNSLYPQCLGFYGNWLADTKCENPKVVIEDFLIPTVDSITNQGLQGDDAMNAYLSLARYTDAQYQQIVDYMGSPTFEAKRNLMKQAKQDAEDLRRMGEKSSRYLRTLDLQSEIDARELRIMNNDRERFLHLAMENYTRCLVLCDTHDLRIFRLTSLWFNNKEHKHANKIMKAASNRVKSYKFLPLMYQLAARMSSPGSGSSNVDLFLTALEHVIEKVAKDHPHHSLSVILALANANKDDEFIGTASGGSKRGKLAKAKETTEDQDRVKAAKALVNRLRSSPCANIVDNMDCLSTMYIELANFNVDQHKRDTKPIKFSSKIRLPTMKNLTCVAVPTVETRIDPTCEYKDIIYVRRFEDTFKLAGGINLPKIITCIGSDGIPRRQLVKGKDDLRQDAVMQQVFGMVNHLLQQDKHAKARKLLIRRYKVIPLSQRSGLLEWCEGTVPFGEYLIGKNGAHLRYRPKDITASSCRAKLQAARGAEDNRFEVYTQICKEFQPVFRHFFMEKFPDPTSWYERRIAYIRSVATNSIVGYILGLGDRHVQNILIDCDTAELIHIDLGVAFEQGKILPTPETVPFRLTRDVVDGMGVTGVEGTFRRSCESTMEVLRRSGEALLTILTVLLYDPLYAWTLSPLKAYALQAKQGSRADTESVSVDPNTTANDFLALAERNTSSSPVTNANESVNQLAERVLLRLQQKLDGLEDSIHLSVSGHVNLLIQQATDPHNLCNLFPGWQPYI